MDVPQGADEPVRHLHLPPEETATDAAAGARTLALSHLMPPAEETLEDVVRRVASRFGGCVEVARDLETFSAG